jgi:hypothetical protein
MMASTTRKPAANSGKSSGKAAQAKPSKAKPAKAAQKAGAGPAIAQRSKDAKPVFGKAAPKKVKPDAAAKPTVKAIEPAAKAPPAARAKAKNSQDGSIANRVARGAKAAANVAAGAVVVTARSAAALASSVVGGSKNRSKPK